MSNLLIAHYSETVACGRLPPKAAGGVGTDVLCAKCLMSTTVPATGTKKIYDLLRVTTTANQISHRNLARAKRGDPKLGPPPQQAKLFKSFSNLKRI